MLAAPPTSISRSGSVTLSSGTSLPASGRISRPMPLQGSDWYSISNLLRFADSDGSRSAQDHFFPALNPRCAVVLHSSYDPSERVALRDGPLRILVVIGSEGESVLGRGGDPGPQRERLDDRVEEVELHVLEQPGRAAFIEDYSRFKPHVLHFIGHGTIDPDDRQPYLVLYDGTVDRNWYWGLSDVVPGSPPAQARLCVPERVPHSRFN